MPVKEQSPDATISLDCILASGSIRNPGMSNTCRCQRGCLYIKPWHTWNKYLPTPQSPKHSICVQCRTCLTITLADTKPSGTTEKERSTMKERRSIYAGFDCIPDR